MLVERFYSYDKIYEAADCLAIAGEIGMKPVKGNSCFNIPWRTGSDSGALSINKNGWKDHVTGESGGVIKLVQEVKFNGDLQQAQQWLGDRLGLTPELLLEREPKWKRRIEYLENEGYQLIKSYEYCNIDKKLIFTVRRYEHQDKKKEFVQIPAAGNSVKELQTVLYNLPKWHSASYVCICEGEKDCDTLSDLNYNSTTNASGGSHWQESYNQYLTGKNIILVVDNDEPGEKRCNFLLWELKDKVNRIKIVKFPGEEKGFDITDYRAKYGDKAVKKLISGSPEIDKTKIKKPNEDYLAISEAKEANKFDFTNYFECEVEGEKKVKPKQINQMLEDLNHRFLNFPRLVGSTLFDHDRDTGKIEVIRKPEELTAWIARKSKRLVNWKSGLGFVAKNEFFAGVGQAAKRYEEIAYSPIWPNPKDVYSAYPALPEPKADCKSLDCLIDFFNPESSEYHQLMYAFFAAPIYYESGISRPCWIIDSECAGAGKTTLAEILGILYGNPPIRTKASELHNKFDELTKRLVSVSGRQVRVLLLDNVTGTLHSPQFADLVTAGSISGRPPYGTGEEIRPNNLTYVITVNSAAIDNDIAIRSYFIRLNKVVYSAGWKSKLIKYVKENRYQIMSDILFKISNHKPFELEPQTRFPEFETKIIQPFCADEDEYNYVLKAINDARDAANIEKEIAGRIEAEFERQLTSNNIPADGSYFILTEVVEKWLDNALPSSIRGNQVSYLRHLAAQGFCEKIDGKTQRIRRCNQRGFLWNKVIENGVLIETNIVGYVRPKEIGIVLR